MYTDTFLQHALVRELAWVIVNPPIIQGLKQHQYWTESSDWQQAYQAFKTPLKKLDANPAELVELLAKQKDNRLGHRFETLLTYWFNHSRRYEILAQNLQIQDTNKTIGEFDFIIKDHARDKVQHWEVACKFYLGINDTAFTQSWVGPMLKDRLDLKYDSMQSRQSKLSEHPAAKQQLKQLGITIDEHIGLMKGRLFHPIQSTKPAHPSLVASDHQHAQWARLEHFIKHFQSSTYQWQVLKKDQWMASQLYCPDHSYLDTDSIAQYFLDRSQTSPLCLAGFLPETSKEHEIKRIFLVAKDWAEKPNFNDNTNSY